MKYLFAALALFTTACASAPDSAPQSEGAPVQLAVSYTLQSQALGEDREINVWTPPGYEQGEERYTVLYLIDGGLDQDFPHIAGLGQLGAVSYTYDSLIVVGVKTGTRIAELTPPAADARYRTAFANAGGAARFRAYVRDDVIPFVETRYRTGERRAIVGESLAGLFIVDTFLNEPALFNDYIAVSPSLWWDDRAFARTAGDRMSRHASSDRRFYLSIADEGGTMREGVDIFRTALAAAPGRVALHFADRGAGETHATTFHPATLDALRWLYAKPPYDYGPTPWWMVDGASPPAQ